MAQLAGGILGTMAWTVELKAREISQPIQSSVTNGISQAQMKFQAVEDDSKAVIIPPRGPAPGHLSSTIRNPKREYLYVGPTTTTAETNVSSRSVMTSGKKILYAAMSRCDVVLFRRGRSNDSAR
jgi:hypothetical protein